MNLVKLLRLNGRVEVSLKSDVPYKVVLKVERGGDVAEMEVDEVEFETGGSILVLHDVKRPMPAAVDDVIAGGPGYVCTDTICGACQ